MMRRLANIRRSLAKVYWFRIFADLAVAATVLTAIGVAVVMIGLFIGYRPVVIQSGSMGDAAPDRSLIIARPVDAELVGSGDIVVLRRPGIATVTHRVIEIEAQGANQFAITQGDRNEAPDAAPYPLEGQQLVSRWVIPRLGGYLNTVSQPGSLLVIIGLALVATAVPALRRIWRPPQSPVAEVATDPGTKRSMPRRLRIVVLFVPLVGVLSAGVAAALYRSGDTVTSNDFSTTDCFDPELASVQSGETVHTSNGIVTVPITAVDPTASFVMASVRSNSNEPADSTVQTVLTGGGASLELTRTTDAGVPPSVTVVWSVVEYGCGVSVQRGTVSGDGTDQLNVTVTAVDQAASFVLASTAAEASATGFGGSDLFITELTSPTSLVIRSAGSGFNLQRSFAWQVVTFLDSADIEVQTVSTTLGAGIGSANLALSPPADPDATFLITGTASTATGPDIGERLIRANLADSTTVALSRGVNGDPVEVQVQVVTLKDGSTVKHGTVDFSAGQTTRTVTIAPVDGGRSTAISTVATPGLAAGGQTNHTADDVLGEASATFELTDAETVTIQRDSVASDASFGWQVIEWAGPQWWDLAYTFRQRIDVDTTTVAAPGGYTVPLTFDHGGLVASNLSEADGSDVRVVRWDGTSWTELDRVLDDDGSWDQATTTVRFRTVDPIEASGTGTYWLYFGNDSPAAAAEDPELVYLLFEDFDAGTLGDFEDRTSGSAWYTADPWTRRIPITVPAATIAADLSEFPLLVSLTSADLAANAKTDGSDIRFTAADGTTALAHEIEGWTSATGDLEAWVKIPVLASSSSNTIYMYYGAANAPAKDDVRATWPDGFEAAWHLNRDPTGTAPQVDDSSARNHDGLSGGGMVAGDLVPGLIAGAADFDGSDDHFQVDPFDVAGAAELTFSGWVNLDSTTSNGRIVTKANDSLDRIFELAVTNTAGVRVRLSLGGATTELVAGAGSVTLGTWHHVAASWDGSTLRVFLNGTEIGSVAASGTLDADSAMPVTIGNLVTLDRPIDGRLDEVRVETIARPVEWLAAVESNQRTPASFISVGAAEGGSWFDQGTWAARKPIVVDADQVGADLTDFALLVQLTDAEVQGAALSDGADLVFTAADGTTRLDHIVETYNGATGSLSAWVSVPLLSSSVDTELFLYYSNPTAVDQQDPAAVLGSEADLTLLGTS